MNVMYSQVGVFDAVYHYCWGQLGVGRLMIVGLLSHLIPPIILLFVGFVCCKLLWQEAVGI